MEKVFAESLCPYCGGHLEIVPVIATSYMFICDKCEVTSKPFPTKEECLRAANERVDVKVTRHEEKQSA